jgi:hypothetical protein
VSGIKYGPSSTVLPLVVLNTTVFCLLRLLILYNLDGVPHDFMSWILSLPVACS